MTYGDDCVYICAQLQQHVAAQPGCLRRILHEHLAHLCPTYTTSIHDNVVSVCVEGEPLLQFAFRDDDSIQIQTWLFQGVEEPWMSLRA